MLYNNPLQVSERSQPVSLAMVPDSYYMDASLEPAMTRTRAANSANITLTSNAVQTRSKPPVECSVSNPSQSILLQRAKRVSMSSVIFRHSTPTINESNDTVLCYDQSSGTIFAFVMAHGDYQTPQQLIKALDNAINASGILTSFFFYFRGTPVPAYVTTSAPDTDNEVLLITTTPVYFLSTSNAMARGRSTFGWENQVGPRWDGINPVNPALAAAYQQLTFTEMLIGPMPCAYTRYVDISSPSLTRWTKLPSTTTQTTNTSQLFRYYFPTFVGYDTDPGVLTTASAIIYQKKRENGTENAFDPAYFTVNPSESITSIDLVFRDEYGDLFVPSPPRYSVTSGTNPATRSAANTVNRDPTINTGGIWWNIILYAEV